MLINRPELRAKGRKRFMANYWNSVLVSLIYVLFVAGGLTVIRKFGHTSDSHSGRISDNFHDRTCCQNICLKPAQCEHILVFPSQLYG